MVDDMERFAGLNAKEDGPAPWHSVGQRIGNDYRVTKVLNQEKGRIFCEAVRMSDGAAVLVQGLSRLALSALGQEAIFDKEKMALLNSGETSTCPLVDAFQLDCEGDTRFYVVKSPTQDTAPGEVAPRTPFEALPPANLRPFPEGTRSCRVYRRGPRYLEVDIPIATPTWRSFFCIALSSIFVYPVSFVLVLTGILLISYGVTVGGGIVGLVAGLFIFSFGLRRLLINVQTTFGHCSFTLSDVIFVNKVTLQLASRFKDSINNQREALKSITCLDYCFCKQTCGRVSELERAKLETISRDDGETTSTIVLMEVGGGGHCLNFGLSVAQAEWLLHEINEVLLNIRALQAV